MTSILSLSKLSKATRDLIRQEIKQLASEETFKPTEEMSKNAIRGLEWRKEYNRGGTEIGVRRAVQLKNKDNLSLDTVRRMHSFFSRHAHHKTKHYDFQEGEPTAWRVAWELWGGDAGRNWAERIVDRYREED